MIYGIFGGAFDPFHNGHLSVIKSAQASGRIDKVIVIPTGMPPHKKERFVTPAPYRFYMTQDVVKTLSDCILSDIELVSEGPSYTLKTLEHLEKAGTIKSCDTIYFICGADVLYSFEQWYAPDKLSQKMKFLVARRPGTEEEEDLAQANYLYNQFKTQIEFIDADLVFVSSSALRMTVMTDEIPDIVQSFIQTHGLYAKDDPLSRIDAKTYQRFYDYSRFLFMDLSRKRMLHSLNTAVLSVRYAVRFGYNPNTALLAGLLHDCAKELTADNQIMLAKRVEKKTMPPMDMMHAPAGAVHSQERYQIDDPEIINAIRYHTTGRRSMSGIEKIVFLADKLEPARPFNDLESIRKKVEIDLDEAMIECLLAVKESLTRQGKTFHHWSQEALDELLEKNI